MRHYNALLCCFALLMLRAEWVTAQTITGTERILTVKEKDQDGKYLDDSGKIRREYTNARIADINSRIEIDINKTALIQALGQKGNFSLPPQTDSLLQRLTKIMQQESVVLNEFKLAIQNYSRAGNDPSKSRAFNASMRRVSNFARFVFKGDPVIQQYYLADTSGSLFDPVFPAVQRRINDIQTELINAKKDSGSSIQLGTWLYHNNNYTPVHLDGFDKIPQGEYYVLERWNVIPSAQQLEQLSQLQQLAKDNRDAGVDILKTVLRNYITNFTGQLEQKLQRNFADFDVASASIKADIGQSPVAADLLLLRAQYEEWITFCTAKVNEYSLIIQGQTPELGQLLIKLNTDISLLNNQSRSIFQTLQKLRADIDALPAQLLTKADSLKRLAIRRFEDFKSIIIPANLAALADNQQLNTAALEFGEEVSRLSLNDLPATAELDLGYTGVRDAGDRLVIKIGSVAGSKQVKTDLETREIMLFRVLPHFEGTVGVIFAHPFTKTAIEKQFQMAPYYNLLFKGFFPWGEKYRRKSALNNTLKDFSWGLHISSPDFNKDDVPELAVGLVISGFKDYLQMGLAHNIFENASFWFFGIRLPVPAMNFGGSGNAQKIPD